MKTLLKIKIYSILMALIGLVPCFWFDQHVIGVGLIGIGLYSVLSLKGQIKIMLRI